MFNAADSCITVGVIVLILASLRADKKQLVTEVPELLKPNDPV